MIVGREELKSPSPSNLPKRNEERMNIRRRDPERKIQRVKRPSRFCLMHIKYHNLVHLIKTFDPEFSRPSRLTIIFYRVLLLLLITGMFTRSNFKEQTEEDDEELTLNVGEALLVALGAWFIKIPITMFMEWFLNGMAAKVILEDFENRQKKRIITVFVVTFIIVAGIISSYLILILSVHSGHNLTKQWLVAFGIASSGEIILYEHAKVIFLYFYEPVKRDNRPKQAIFQKSQTEANTPHAERVENNSTSSTPDNTVKARSHKTRR
mmetsp:Transcript_21702/g.24561  ORF Transcript_21702/g.24561 Transcript_21702/m.24561 type:complete len:266 (-) Transcript_21702:100-897(-)